MASSLTVRNLTSSPILISRIECFEDPNALQSRSTGYFFGSGSTSSVAPTSPQLSEHATTFNHQEIEVKLEPFESFTFGLPEHKHDEKATELSSKTLRLTIETSGGGRYRIDTNPSYTQKSTQSLAPLTSSSNTTYIALFHPSRPTPHLTIHSNHTSDYRKWMATLSDTLPLSAISIPGTHNSHTHYRALPSVRCQVTNIKSQLESGIRFLDIRVQPVHATDPMKKDLYLVHGAFTISLTGHKYFEPILQTCYNFLAAHPSETILMSLKREGVGSSTDEHLAAILERHYLKPHAAKWYTESNIPYLGTVRGKIVLIRRYTTTTTTNTITTSSSSPSSTPRATGLDATAWPHNATHALFPSSTSTFCLQDFCEVLVPASIALKTQYSLSHLARAAECVHHIPGVNTDVKHPVPPGPLYLNFLSGSNFWKRACWPEVIAKTVNREMEEWVCRGHWLDGEGEGNGVRRKGSGDGGTGVVVMDFVGDGGDWELVRLVVGMNMGVLRKVSGLS